MDKKEELKISLGLQNLPLDVWWYITQSFEDLDECRTIPKKIPIDELPRYSTACGLVHNKPFKASVISLLKEFSNEPYVLGECYLSPPEDLFTCLNMAVCWSGSKKEKIRHTRKFAKLVGANGGSLREEEVFEDGWDCYESE